jgi:hypothetical protein
VPTAKVDIPAELQVSPVHLTCPRCKVKAGQNCMTTSGGLAAVHLERMQAAAMATRKNKLASRHSQRKK